MEPFTLFLAKHKNTTKHVPTVSYACIREFHAFMSKKNNARASILARTDVIAHIRARKGVIACSIAHAVVSVTTAASQNERLETDSDRFPAKRAKKYGSDVIIEWMTSTTTKVWLKLGS